jgi:transposase-like protein
MKAKEEPKLSDNPSKGRVQPPIVRQKALTLYAQGHAVPDIARNIGVDATTIRRWIKQNGVTHGGALGQVSEEPVAPVQLPTTEDVLTPTERLMNAEQVMAAIETALQRPGDTADRYQAIMVALGLNILKTTAAMPPAVKNMRDLATLNEILRTNMGLNAKGAAGGGLAINLNVLTKGAKTEQVTVEAELVDPDAESE